MRHSSKHAGIFAVSTLAIATMLAGAVHAQTLASPPGGEGQLEEIVVTAQKTSTGLQKTPIAITALSPEQLQRADIRSVIDLDKQVPGVVIADSGAFPLNVTIRGVGYDGLQNNSAQPGVAFVQDGVYIASPVNLAATFLDLAQVEVLRGPQGTVNGQNADGGAINITTGVPVLGAFHASGEASYGSYEYNRLRGVVNIPVGDTFSVRAAFQHEGHGGWIHAPNAPGFHHIGNQDAWSGRVTAQWKPTDRLTLTAWAEFFDNDTRGLGVKNLFDPIAGARTVSDDYATPTTVRSRIYAGTIAYDLGFATLKSITSYQKVYYNARTSGDLIDRADAIALYGVKDEIPINERANHSVTEEINLSHTGGKLDWIVGAFYLHTKGEERVFETQQSSATPIAYTPNFDPTGAEIGALFGEGLAFVSRSNEQRKSAAGYGQATYHLTDSLRVLGGIRYSWDKYSAETEAFYAAAVPLQSKFTEVTGKGVVEYDVARGSTLYASFSTGVKPGGTNLNPGATVIPTSFKHEFVRSYEVGSKNELFDRKLRVNLSGFYNDYRNLQSDSEDPLPYEGGITNIPKSQIYGIEGEVSLILPAGFRIDANAAAMHSKVDSHFLAIDPYIAQIINRDDGGPYVGNDLADRALAFQDLKGNQLGRVPHFSTSGSISKTTDFIGLGALDLFLQANYRGAYWFRVFNNANVDRVPSQFTMNFNARFQPEQHPWYVELQVTNLTGSDDTAARYAENFGVGAVFNSPVPPRQIIGRVGFNF